jgi:putative peptidoglycan lipid II flippase
MIITPHKKGDRIRLIILLGFLIMKDIKKTISFSAFLIAFSTLVSGLLGILKMRLLVERFDVGFALDSYFAAFRIPDFISVTLITGGIIVSFLPLFSEYFLKSKDKGWELTNNILNIIFVFLSFICLTIWIFAPQLINLIVPGFSQAQKELTITLTRIMFVSPLIFSISGIFSGMLHYFDRFLSYSLAPIFYNIGIISGILFFPIFFSEEKKIYAVAFGVVFGALLHLLIQIPSAIRSGYRYKPIFKIRDSGLKKIFLLMFPRMISQASSQVNLIVITAIASVLTAGSVAVFNLANNLFLFPVSMIGVSFAIAAFPSFSRSIVDGKKDEFIFNFSSTFRQIIFVMVPFSAMFFILRAQIVRIILGAGDFGWTETKITAASLGVFALGMVFAALIPLIIRAFFSFQDTKTPATISVVSVLLNIVLSFCFVFLINNGNIFYNLISNIFKLKGVDDIRVIGLIFSVTVSIVFQFILLLIFFKKKINYIPFKEIFSSFMKIFIASFFMSLAAYIALRVAVLFVSLTTFWAVFFQASFSFTIGLVVYLLVLCLLKSKELNGFWQFISKNFNFLK